MSADENPIEASTRSGSPNELNPLRPMAKPVWGQPETSQLLSGSRRALARAITLVESTRADHRQQAVALTDAVAPYAGRAFRVGISGTPGVGKSTFIEAFGLHLCNALNLKVAVLAVDPSSVRTGGSILGDKTRMTELARHPNAFIRPSPSGGTLGGVARRTRDVMQLCDATGYDVILVETVGVGQSEIAVSQMTDAFVLLVAPAGGDELQGVKRGIMELADVLVVNKCDGALEAQARATLGDYSSALRLVRPSSPSWTPVALAASALSGLGVAELWTTLGDLRNARASSGEADQRRADQNREWLWSEVRERIIAGMRSQPGMAEIENAVAEGTRSPSAAAEDVLHQLLR
jgi:LAO/AO transport system kinase